MLPATERHPHARAVLNGALPPDGRPSHAYLFHGPGGSGKATVARAFAVALLSDGAADPDSVRARVEHGVHPDLTWVTPSGAAVMLVSDIDEPVVAAATRTPFEARRRVFVIERAETMNDQAANRMLKTLEEPAAFAHIVLLSDRPGEILPTIAYHTGIQGGNLSHGAADALVLFPFLLIAMVFFLRLLYRRQEA